MLFFLIFLIFPAFATPLETRVQETRSGLVVSLDVPSDVTIYGPDSKGGFPPSLTWKIRKNIGQIALGWPHKPAALFEIPIHLTPQISHEKMYAEGHLEVLACAPQGCSPLSIPLVFGSSQGLWHILLMALLGGIFLNFMPCVLPLLSLKIFSLTRSSSRKNLWFMVLGSGTFFLGFGAIICFLRQVGVAAGWGMHFQSPYFLTFFLWILTLFTARLWGVLHLNRLSVFHRIMPSSSFFEGFFTALVATPCSAPFLGTAAGFALTQPLFVTVLIFTVLWIGFSLPFVALMMLPRFFKMPKPGPWLHTFEKILGGIFFLTSAWIAWVLIQSIGKISGFFIVAGMIVMFVALRYAPQGRVLLVSLVLWMVPFWTNPPLPQSLQHLYTQAKTERILVKIGAEWCLTCKANDLVLEFQKDLLKKNNIRVVSLDWTRRDPEITQLIQSHGRDGVPFMILMGPQGNKILPELITPHSLKKFL